MIESEKIQYEKREQGEYQEYYQKDLRRKRLALLNATNRSTKTKKENISFGFNI